MGKFELTDVPQDQLVAYYGLGFASAAADGRTEKEEMVAVFESLDLAPLDEEHRRQIRGYVLNPPDLEACVSMLSEACDELRFSVVVSVVETLLADDIMEDQEQMFLDEVCARLKVREDQKKAIINFVSEARRVTREGLNNNAAEKTMKSAAAGLGAVGVPIAAVYFGGSVVGLSAAGITSGLAALGLGFGMVPGIGLGVLIGTGVFIGVKTILGDSRKKKEKLLRAEKEHKAQLVIRNLQETISHVVDKIGELESKAVQSEANEAAIQILTERLSALKHVLGQRKAQLQ